MIDIFPQSVLFGISFTLKAKKKLTTTINCFHSWSVIDQIENLVCRSFMWTLGSTAGAEELPPTTAGGSFNEYFSEFTLFREFEFTVLLSYV